MRTYDEPPPRFRPEAIEEQVRRKGITPITDLAEMACDVFGSDEEMEEFIAYTYRCRREGHA